MGAGYSVSLGFDHAALVAAGKAQADGDDLRVYYFNGAGWTELDRALDPLSAWNSATTQIWFRLVNPIGSSSSDNGYYIYYGDPGVSNPPDDWANVFRMGDDFNDGTLTSGLSTSLNGAASISETAGAARISGGSVNADAGILVANNSLPASNQFVIRHKVSHLSGGTGLPDGCCNPEVKLVGIAESPAMPDVTTSAIENPRRRIVVYHRSDTDTDPGQELTTSITYFDTAGSPVHWDGSTWVAGNGNWTTQPLNTYFILDVVSDGTQWYVVFRDAAGTILTQTTPVAWSSVREVGDPSWFYWGEVYTNAYWNDEDSDWVYLRDYVSSEPTSSLGIAGIVIQYRST